MVTGWKLLGFKGFPTLHLRIEKMQNQMNSGPSRIVVSQRFLSVNCISMISNQIRHSSSITSH